jgi:hypothetical protein
LFFAPTAAPAAALRELYDTKDPFSFASGQRPLGAPSPLPGAGPRGAAAAHEKSEQLALFLDDDDEEQQDHYVLL